MKVNVYIDGFNLFYGMLKGTSYKWLDLEKFAEAIVASNIEVVAIKDGSSGNLVGTPVAVFNHGKHRRPHSRDTEGSMKETFGQLADVRPFSKCQEFGIINA